MAAPAATVVTYRKDFLLDKLHAMQCIIRASVNPNPHLHPTVVALIAQPYPLGLEEFTGALWGMGKVDENRPSPEREQTSGS